jgi:hypothetical protein
MNRIMIPITLACLCMTAVAARTLELIEGAYEAVLADVIFPAHIAGDLIVRLCPDCEPHVLPVESGTAYIGSTGPMSLEEFLADVDVIRRTPDGNSTTAVGVFYSLETNRVTRVSLHLK